MMLSFIGGTLFGVAATLTVIAGGLLTLLQEDE